MSKYVHIPGKKIFYIKIHINIYKLSGQRSLPRATRRAESYTGSTIRRMSPSDVGRMRT